MIKISSRFIFAVLAATAVLALSCTKEIPAGQDSDPKASQAEGSRVISVSFAPSTKTALEEDGLTPYFELGDEILLCAKPSESNTEPQTQTCKVKYNDSGKAYITTNLEGDLYAIYPTTAVKKFVNDKSGEEKETLGVYVPSVQSGKFSDANILTGGISKKTNEVILEPYSALLRFYVDKSIGVKSIKVIGTTMRINDEEGTSSSITTVTAPEGKTLDEVTDDPKGRLCYVAVPDDINITGVSFEIETTSQGVVKKTTKATGKFSDGKIYNVFIPYYIEVNAGSEDNPEYQKWGYCNIGAFLPEEPGYFFSWGNTVGYTFDGTNWIVAPGYEQAGTVLEGGFSEANYNLSAGHNLDNDIPLDATYDAALASCGEGWRMPTKSEFEKLISVDVVEEKWNNVNGLKFNTSPYPLFFPTFGYGDGTEPLEEDCHYGNYWSSSLYSSAHGFGWFLELHNGEAGINDGNRSYGYSVRPIYNEPVPDGALPGVFTVSDNGTPDDKSDDKKIRFSKGNLQAKYSKASNSYSWQFAADQYQHIVDAPGNTTIASQSDGALVDLFSWSTSSTNYGITTSTTESFFSGDFLDWGTAYCESNNVTPNTTWRTMSVEEWQYLFGFGDFTNDTRNGLYAKGITVMGQTNCVVLYPDGYSGTKVSNNDNSTYNSKEAWDEAQNAGVVCLPPTSNRNGSTVFSVYINDRLCYWTSSKANDSRLLALFIQYSKNDFKFEEITGVDGRAVRLVTNVK